MHAAPSPAFSQPRPRAVALVAAVAFVVAAARYLPFIDEPWDGSLVTACSCNYTARVERSYERAGFWKLKGQPAIFALPTQAAEAWPNIHHPPTFYWLTHVAVSGLGFTERAFRVVPILLSSAAAAMLAALLARRLGTGWALLGTAFFAACPMSWFYGWMANFEGGVLLLVQAMLFLHMRLRTRTLAAWWPVAAVFFAATWMDVTGVFGGATLLVYELLQPGGSRRIGRVLLLGPVWIVSLGALWALDSWWIGSPGEAFRILVDTTNESIVMADGALPFANWWAVQATFWNSLYTLPVSLLSVLAVPIVAWRAVRRRDPLAIEMVALIVPAVLNAAAFRGHASTHDFWWFHAIPWTVAASVLAVRWLSGVHVLAGRALAIALAAWIVGAGVRQIDQRRNDPGLRRDFREVAADLDTFATPEDALIVSDETVDAAAFYAHCWVFDHMAFVLDRFVTVATSAPRPLRVQRLVFLLFDDCVASFNPNLLTRLTARGTLERLTADDLARRAPALARHHPGVGMYVLTVK